MRIYKLNERLVQIDNILEKQKLPKWSQDELGHLNR